MDLTLPSLRNLHDQMQAVWEEGRPRRYSGLEDEYRRVRDACGWIDLSSEGKLRFLGEDRKGWLQGQVTNDLNGLNPGGTIETCVLSPTGQIVTEADLWSLDDSYIGLIPGLSREASLKRLKSMLILEDVTIEDRSEGYGLVSVQGPAATEALADKIELPRLSCGIAHVGDAVITLLRHDRTGVGGWDVLFPESASAQLQRVVEGISPVGWDAYHALRIECGFPTFGLDIDSKTLVMEMGPDYISRHVSFEKGCYTGQEIVERIRARGHTNRLWVGLLADEPLSIGGEISHSSRKDAGAVMSVGWSPDYGPIGTAMIRLEAARDGDTVTVATAAGVTQAEVVIMPIRRG